jgi:hypothetical protein
MALQILQDPNVKVGRNFLVFGGNLRFRQIDQAVAHALAEMFVARRDQ